VQLIFVTGAIMTAVHELEAALLIISRLNPFVTGAIMTAVHELEAALLAREHSNRTNLKRANSKRAIVIGLQIRLGMEIDKAVAGS
jgi:hypothetical protein